jgi:uncharacterized membrane protein YqaE (UPF0057 family)
MEARPGPPRRWSRAVTILIPVVWVWLYEVTGPREVVIVLLVSCLGFLCHCDRSRLVVAFAPTGDVASDPGYVDLRPAFVEEVRR